MESFTRIVALMENSTGVQDSGSLTFSFDPGYQQLLFHSLRIHRQGRVLNRLDESKIRIIQPEPELGGHLLTGTQTALIFVEDLRVGDVLEYAYTIHGANPVLNGHYAARWVVQSGAPIQRQRLRLVWTSASPIYLRRHLTDAEPKIEPSGAGTNYLWDFENLPAISFEGNTPAGFQPYPYIELSDFSAWSRVVAWALPLYEFTSSDLPPELHDLVAKWQKDSSANEERARLAVDFVQDELRYTGLELGPDSFRPAPPFETFRLRYGDCKGKALLLCVLLKAMNIEAYPALVNASALAEVARRLPSPFAFNHAIVKILLDGKTLWIDATQSHQGGTLPERHVPAYGKALVLKKAVTSLEDIPPSDHNSR
jgi:transglutaminase-like putative cysteine protease